MKIRFFSALFGVCLTLILTACGGGSSSVAPALTCMLDGTTFGAWQSVFSGFGCVAVVPVSGVNTLHENPSISTLPTQTAASLVLGPTLVAPFTFQGEFQTVAQLRQGSAPNPWEVAWLIWNYTDINHYYYFIPRTSGWELGEHDPTFPGGQQFLQTATAPAFTLGAWHSFKIVFSLNYTMSVYIDNVLITTFQDTTTLYPSGRIGLYNEDASVNFRNITTINSDVPTATTAVTTVNF